MGLVITMSRRYGTGASTIAKELSERLGLPVYDKVNVEQEVRKMLLRRKRKLSVS